MAFPSIDQIAPDISLYRPWVWIELGPSGIRINDPGGEDSKFRWLKSFQFAMGENRGASVEFVIYDNRGNMNQKWLRIIRKVIEEQGGEFPVIFQWGWSARTVDSNGIGGKPSLGSPGLSSHIHKMILTGVEMEYIQGGINYKFTGQDQFSLVQSASMYEDFTSKSFKEAVDNLKDNLKLCKILPQNFEVRYSDLFKEIFDYDVATDRWEHGGISSMNAVQNWLSKLKPRSISLPKKDEPPLPGPVFSSSTTDWTGIYFDVSPNKMINKFVLNSQEYFHVNPPNQSLVGRHAVIGFKPNHFGNLAWASEIVYQNTGSSSRTVSHSDNKNSEMVGKRCRQGVNTSLATQRLDDSTSTDGRAAAFQRFMDGVVGSIGSYFLPKEIQLEVIGMPQIERVEDLMNLIKIKVWNPAFINDKSEDAMWVRNPPSDPRYNSLYYLSGFTHSMDSEGAYTTVLSLIPGPTPERKVFGGEDKK